MSLSPASTSSRISYYEADTDIGNLRYYALKEACKSGMLSTVQSILQTENSVGPVLDQPEPLTQKLLQKCLFEAFTNSNFDVARYLIQEAGARIESNWGWHAWLKPQSVEAFAFLVQEGWDINAPVYGSMTALSFVVSSLPLTKWFLEHGADPNLGPPCTLSSSGSLVSDSGLALELAACGNPATAVAIIDLLIQHGAKLENSLPLHLAAECGPYKKESWPAPPPQVHLEPGSISTPPKSRIPVLQHLIDLGYDPNACDRKKFRARSVGPPLYWALQEGASRIENIRFLLEHGADPWVKDRHGRNALEVEMHNRPPGGGRELEELIREFM